MIDGEMASVIEARVSELLAASVPFTTIGWFAHRTASPEALDLLDAMAERSGDAKWLAAAGYERGTRARSLEDARKAAEQLMVAIESVRIPGPYQALLVDLLVLLHEDDAILRLLANGELRALTSTRRQMLDADLANPFRTPGKQESDWLSKISLLLGDLAPVQLGPAPEGEGYEPFDRLTTQLQPGTVHGELVSVVVSSFRPGPALMTSVRSLLAQTWGDLEILVVDDASGPEYADVYAEVEDLDDRVRVIRQSVNGGTYVARNTAIDLARGTYITFQDADDWSHPERIERQVYTLQQDKLVHSVRARSLRPSGSLVFSRQGNSLLAPGAVTLMFRRQQVWPILGSYDSVRKAADTEFHERIRAALPGYGVDLPDPLLWYRVSEESLSRSEFRARWRHPARMLYQSAWAWWHDQIRSGASPRLDRGQRRFPAPHRFRLDQTARPDEYDLVVIGDWRGGGSAARDAVEWIRLLATDGVRIALLHAESLNLDGRRAPWLMDSVRRMAAEGTIDVVPWGDTVETRSIVAVEPEVLEFLPEGSPGPRAQSLVVLLDGTPRTKASIRHTEAVVRARWNARVVWSPRGAHAPHLGESIDKIDMVFPSVIPAKPRRPLHRPEPVVVVAPIGFNSEVLDATAEVGTGLAEARLDVRISAAAGIRQAIRKRGDVDSPRVFWTGTPGGAIAHVAVATDLVLIGPSTGIEFDRLIDEARAWGVRTHHWRTAGPIEAELNELVERIRAARPVTCDTTRNTVLRREAEAAVRAWFRLVAALG